jgi:hypothetical protein
VLVLLTAGNASAQSIVEGPTIPDEAQIGQTLTATSRWAPPDATPSYQWWRCPAPGQCEPIPGAEAVSYTVADADAGYRLGVQLTVTWFGFDRANSNLTQPVPWIPPANITPPGIAGEQMQEGRELTSTPGSWSGTPPLSFAQQWQRCDAAGLNCAPIPGAIGPTYRLSPADVGMTLRVVVTATNGGGSVSASSQPAGPVGLINLVPPAITGVAEVERTLVAMPGSWRASGSIGFIYQWLRCNGTGSDCNPIAMATGATYQVRMADIGFRLQVRVTAVSDVGPLTRDSAPSALVPAPAGVQSFTQGGNPSVAPAAALMRPFPRVRIKGYVTSSGAVLQLVRVRGPARVRVALACRGQDCPFRRRVRRGGPRIRLRSLEQAYRARARLTIRITKRAVIGKYTRIRIRASRPPTRRDRCLLPGSDEPVRCPTNG